MDADVIIVGAGVVGAALAFGIAKKGRRVLVLDGEDRDLRAARANFGLVWVQGKGANFPPYSALTRLSSDLWPRFLEEISTAAETRVDYARPGGLAFCLGQDEYDARAALIKRMHNQPAEPDTEMLERADLEKLLPALTLGKEVTGASYCSLDGHTNPLQLLAALHRAIPANGGTIVYRCPVAKIAAVDGGFEVTGAGRYRANLVIVAAGIATPTLTEPLGLKIPIRSERGQLIVTERLDPILPIPASGLRQTAEGTIMIGATKETAVDRGVTTASATVLASRAIRIVPALRSARLVRQWSGFRIIPPDGAPIYAESERYPGLFAAVCHSGVTLAAAHAGIVAPAMIEGRLSKDLSAFSNGRFDVQECA